MKTAHYKIREVHSSLVQLASDTNYAIIFKLLQGYWGGGSYNSN